MTVSIIVLHYGEIENTILCIKSISELIHPDFKIELLVVRNSLNIKDQISKIKNTYKKSKIIINEKNLGFAGGMNVGVREALKDKDCKYILILNNDTILPPSLLSVLLKSDFNNQCHSEHVSESDQMLNQVQHDTGVNIISPVIKFKWDNKWIYDYGGKINWWTGRTTHVELSNYPIIQLFNKQIDYVSGCCMLVKREVFETIGLFDESYFFYFEDVDFCLRARKAGFTIAVNPNINIEHKLGGSIGRWSNKAIYYNLKSNAVFIAKHLGLRIPIGYFYLFILTSKILFDRLFSFLHLGGVHSATPEVS